MVHWAGLMVGLGDVRGLFLNGSVTHAFKTSWQSRRTEPTETEHFQGQELHGKVAEDAQGSAGAPRWGWLGAAP